MSKGALRSIEVYPEDLRPGRPSDVRQEAKDRAKTWRDQGFSARVHERHISVDSVLVLCVVVVVRHKEMKS